MQKTIDCLPLTNGKKWELSLRGIDCIGEIRGWKLNHSIFLELPLEHDGFSQVVAGSGSKVKYHDDGFFISFNSKVLQVQKEISLLAIQYPEVFNKYGLRKSDRLQANFPLRFSCGTSGTPRTGEGVVSDISRTGFLIRHLNPLRVEEVISVSAPLIGGVFSDQRALVRNTRKSANSSPLQYETGIEFLEVSPINRNLINDFMRSRSAERRRRPRQLVV